MVRQFKAIMPRPIKVLLRQIFSILGNPFMRLVAFIMLPSPKEHFDPCKVRGILAYGQMGIGNMVLFTPVLKFLRSYFEDAHMDILSVS